MAWEEVPLLLVPLEVVGASLGEGACGVAEEAVGGQRQSLLELALLSFPLLEEAEVTSGSWILS